MPTYRVLTLGPNRKIEAAKDIECANDEEAITKAKQLLDGHDIELWEHGRFLSWFPPKKAARPDGA